MSTRPVALDDATSRNSNPALIDTLRGRAGHSTEPSHGVRAVQSAAEAIARIAGEGRRLAVEGPFGTERGLFQNAGTPTVVRRPGHSGQRQPDEWILQSDLQACDRFSRRLADRLLV
jgi:acetylornithine deacetylase/succinyl-diaminopimelate desuccinylase-like protein